MNYLNWNFYQLDQPYYLLAFDKRKICSRGNEMSARTEMRAELPQVAAISCTFNNMHINDTRQTLGINVVPIAGNNSVYVTDGGGRGMLFSEICIAASDQWRIDKTTGIIISMMRIFGNLLILFQIYIYCCLIERFVVQNFKSHLFVRLIN
jgi:hypothetical protein